MDVLAIGILLDPDSAMLARAGAASAAGGSRPSPCLLVDHDDAEREYAYASTSLTDPAAAEPITTTARQGFTLVSMRREWTTVLADG